MKTITKGNRNNPVQIDVFSLDIMGIKCYLDIIIDIRCCRLQTILESLLINSWREVERRQYCPFGWMLHLGLWGAILL